MATSSITSKDEFRNVTDGWLGVVTIDHTGKASGTSVEPGGSCFMTEEEQILTANAPRSDADNPFTNGSLRLLRRGLEIKNRRPYGADVVETEQPEAVTDETETETGATPTPAEPEPETGVSAPGEEVATPAAARRRKPR